MPKHTHTPEYMHIHEEKVNKYEKQKQRGKKKGRKKRRKQPGKISIEQ